MTALRELMERIHQMGVDVETNITLRTVKDDLEREVDPDRLKISCDFFCKDLISKPFVDYRYVEG